MNGDCSWSDPLKNRWFYPITRRIEELENTTDVFSRFGSITLPESPDWVVRCIWGQVGPYREMAVIERYDRIRARNVGAMLGAKAALGDRLARGNLWFAQLSSKRQAEFEKLFGGEAVSDAKRTWTRFAVEIQPELKRLRRSAAELVMKQETFEQMQFHQGVAKGLTILDELRKLARRQNKRGLEYQRRSLICAFAVEHWEVIEAAKKDIAWSDVVEGFVREFGEVDEETFKKMLQRSGLRVGRVGRPRDSG